ncbi:hypothetical protein JCM10908_004789 [Rhodotorula pacifica]|uniref:zinc finger MYND domain-containing protein n=1 Tax=Rhodotorula pacifica TaxID=1495444 RepID=UPI003180A9C0
MEDTSCVLCGLPAKLRCSRCAQGGKDGTGRPIDIYFCSTEHQDLAWPIHKKFCGKRAYPIQLPVFDQKDAERIIDIMSDEATLDRFLATHPDFEYAVTSLRGAFGPSLREIKLNIESVLNRDDLVLIPSGLRPGMITVKEQLTQRYLQLVTFLNAYTLETGGQPSAINPSLACYWALASNTFLLPDDLWHAEMAHRLLIWYSTSPSGSEVVDDPIISECALIGFQEFLKKALKGEHHAAAAQVLTLLDAVPTRRDRERQQAQAPA